MAKRRKTSSARGPAASVNPEASSASSVAAAVAPRVLAAGGPWPSASTRVWVSLLIVLQLGLLCLNLSANLAPSFLHGNVLAWLAPVNVTTAQDYIFLPLELTHAGTIDAPLQVEYRQASSEAWRPVPLLDPADVARTRWHNVGRLTCWIAEQQPSSDVLPELAAQVLRSAQAQGQVEQASEIRFYQPHVLSFDEDLVVAEGQGEFISSTLSGEVLYAVHVVTGPNGEIGVVPEQEPSLTSKPLPAPAPSGIKE